MARGESFRQYRTQDQLLIKARIKPDLRYLFYISTSPAAESMKPVDRPVAVVASPISTNPSLRSTTPFPNPPCRFSRLLLSLSLTLSAPAYTLSSQRTTPLAHPPVALYPRGFSPLQPDSSISQSSKGYRFYEPPRRACTRCTQLRIRPRAPRGQHARFHTRSSSNEERRRVPGRRALLPTAWQYSTTPGKFPLQSYGNACLHLSRI